MKRNLKLFAFLLLVTFSGITGSCKKDVNVSLILTKERKTELSNAVDSVFGEVGAPGVIVRISVDGEPDITIKRGAGNLVTNAAMSENDYFRIASNTKTFTGTAILILAGEGKLSLDSTISYYLPELQIPNGNKITVRMLGNMTSGLYDYTSDSDFWASYQTSNYTAAYTPDSILSYAFSHPVMFAPGADFSYCNTNTILLGLLMEKVTGKTARQVIKEKVIDPMNLKNTYWPNSSFLLEPYTHGYSSHFGLLADATNWNPSWGYAAGALVSNLDDMKIWAKAVAEGALLSDEMKSERFGWIQGPFYQYGFCLIRDGNWIGHTGSIFGYNSNVFYHPVKKITMIIFVNMETNTPALYFAWALRPILEKQKMK